MKRLPILLVLVLFLLAGCSGEENAGSGATGPTSGAEPAPRNTTGELRIVTIDAASGEEVKVRVEIADEPTERVRGLMDRTSLGENRGMLFVFEEESTRAFWMKNTLIPLSIAFIDSDSRIVDIQKMKPEGGDQTVLDAQLPRYVSAEPAKYALEVNQGFFEEHGVEVGDTAELPDV